VYRLAALLLSSCLSLSSVGHHDSDTEIQRHRDTYTLIFQEERQHLVYLESELCRAGEARPDEAAEDAEEAEEAGE
jgi:hypothetical protein